MKIISPFGPKIAVIRIPRKIINQINLEVNNVLKSKKRTKQSDYSKKLVGEVQQEIQLSKNFVKKYLIKFINSNVKKYIKKTINRRTKTIKLNNLWIVRQYKNEYNPVHFHSGHISGVGYLKIPNNITKSRKRLKTNGTIDFIHGSKSFLNNSIFNHKPKVGDLILFPNYLMHTAYPFNIEKERRSFSFNAKIIFNK